MCLRAEHVRDLRGTGSAPARAAWWSWCCRWDAALPGRRARAEMAAALRVVDYVVADENDDLDALAGALGPADWCAWKRPTRAASCTDRACPSPATA